MSHELYTPSPFANVPWEDISLDFILKLPWTTKGFDKIFMDKFFSREVIRLHGLSPSIVLDRAPQFENHVLRILLEKLGTKLYSYHPQTNGQNEIENIALPTIPRVILKGKHNSRDKYAYNRVVHKNTYISTFEVVCGLNPLSLFDLLPFPNPQGFVPKEKVTKTEYVKMHKRIEEHIQQPKEKYYKKLPKTIEKQREWQLQKVDFYTTSSTNSFALFDNYPRLTVDSGGRA